MITRVLSLVEQATLPRYRKIALGYEPTYYGASANIARQFGLKSEIPQSSYVWSHGCRLLDPEDTLGPHNLRIVRPWKWASTEVLGAASKPKGTGGGEQRSAGALELVARGE
jgi:hypothetical protein